MRISFQSLAIAFPVLVSFTTVAFGAELILPSEALERSGLVHAIFRTSPLVTGHGELSIEWTDSYGRVVDRRAIAVELNDETDIGFDLDLRRAEAMQNELRARLALDGRDKNGKINRRDQEAQLAFIAKPPIHTWWDYDIIMWQHYSPEYMAKLTALGVNGGEWIGRERSVPEFLLRNNLRWYAENIATDFYSAYHHYYGDRDNGYEFIQARLAHKKDPASLEPFKRHPSFTDRELAARLFRSAGLRPQFAITDEKGGPVSGVETHVFRNGDVTIVGLLSNPSLRVDELGPPDFRSNEHFAQRRALKLILPAAFSVYNLRAAKPLGRQREIRVDLDPYEPVIYAISAEPLPALTISGPVRLTRGETGHLGTSFGDLTPAAVHVLHVTVMDPAGHIVSAYSGNVCAPHGRAVWSIPVAYNDAAGRWHVRVNDLLSGATQTSALEVF